MFNHKKKIKNFWPNIIKKDKISAVIDDIEGIIIVKEKNPINEILEKSNNIMKNNLKDLIKYSLNKNVKHKINVKELNGKPEVDRYFIKGDEMDLNMAMQLGMPGMFNEIVG